MNLYRKSVTDAMDTYKIHLAENLLNKMIFEEENSMKQKVLAVLVMTAMLGTSVVPVTAAEFNSGEETAAVQENDTAGLEEEFSSGVNAGYDYDDDDDYDDYDDRKKKKKAKKYSRQDFLGKTVKNKKFIHKMKQMKY